MHDGPRGAFTPLLSLQRFSIWYFLLKMMVKQNQVHVLLVLTVTFIHGVSPTQAPSPGGVATLKTEYTITGARSNYTGFIWVRPTDGRYVVTCNPSCSPVAGYSATMNATHSTLTIHSVGVNDAGTWRIQDAINDTSAPQGVWEVMVSKTPECNISSDVDTDALELGTNLTVTVYINDYYCSQETGFNLTTGAVMETLSTKHNVSDVQPDVINKTINIVLSRFGDVTVSFACDIMSSDLSCSGVKRLLKSPPQCNISSDTDTDVLEPGTNLTLTVDIRGYYCSQQAGFDLTTGSVTDVLLQNQTTHNITDTVQHHFFNVSSDRFGNVSVMFRCDNSNRSITCDGVSKLSAASSPTTAPTSTAAPSPTTSPTSTDQHVARILLSAVLNNVHTNETVVKPFHQFKLMLLSCSFTNNIPHIDSCSFTNNIPHIDSCSFTNNIPYVDRPACSVNIADFGVKQRTHKRNCRQTIPSVQTYAIKLLLHQQHPPHRQLLLHQQQPLRRQEAVTRHQAHQQYLRGRQHQQVQLRQSHHHPTSP
ncbi:uncharacterized protein LOC124122847 isoform X4 [Haliotis rufescens]|uniref:uncharacterized protein LOC124122847 isoform X4 n=1 Tax=Haliotis rufescens TaxID=6454 RepID=UPI00201F1B58|nr:uncharacterized protein LOC124122847 isoform X4 [Haliotis rufescens]